MSVAEAPNEVSLKRVAHNKIKGLKPTS